MEPTTENVAVVKHGETPTTADVLTRARSIDRGDLRKVTKSLSDETARRQDALDAAQDQEARLWFATGVLDALAEQPDAVSIDLVDWQDEVEQGASFDVALDKVYDADEEEIDDLDLGAISIRHHWVLDELRAEPAVADGDTHHPGHRISVTKAVAWLDELLAERL